MIKIASFFEEHVEKIVLVVVGIVCVFLLIFRVLLSPNVVDYDQKKFSPAAVDDYVYKQAEPLRHKLDEPPTEPNESEKKLGDFVALLDSAVSNIDTSLWLQRPYNVPMDAAIADKYNPPRNIGEVNDVAVEHIRAVAYVPTDVITEDNTYDKAANEPNDLDLVTVEGRFDIQALYDELYQIFVEDVEEQWADPCLAKPVFAGVQLQRQELLPDGTWSEWQNVPRTKIDRHNKLFQIIEDKSDLPPGGLKVQMLQFDDVQVQVDLLQPEAYQIASANEDWLPPVLHRRFVEFQRKEAMEEKRQARETEKQEREKELEDRRNRRSDTARTGGTAARGGGRSTYDTLGGADGLSSRDTRSRDRGRDRLDQGGGGRITETGRTSTDRSRRRTTRDRTDGLDMRDGGVLPFGTEVTGRTPRGPSINDVYDEYDALLLNRTTDFSKIREPLAFWAHDDTVEPKKTYRYQIRLGVFNPVAGASQSSKPDKSPNDEVILWSSFSDVTEPIEIPGKFYFFAKNIRESDKTVTVQVSKLVLGHWYSHDFPVKHGEVIGNEVETEPEKEKPKSTGMGRFGAVTKPEDGTAAPETIDYATGAVMVDTVAVNDWSGSATLRTRHYYDMLYSFDGVGIEHMPVSTTYWAADLQTVFSDIGRLEREPQEAFKPFGQGGRRRRPGGLESDGMEEYDVEMYEEMMMDQMGRY